MFDSQPGLASSCSMTSTHHPQYPHIHHHFSHRGQHEQHDSIVNMGNPSSPQSRPSCALAGKINLERVDMDMYESFEDVSDEDNISDDDCYESIPIDMEDKIEEDPARKLLDFATMVNGGIQKYFGAKHDQQSCDIYEDRWNKGKSGRELYYYDLLRIARGGEDVDDRDDKTYTGKMDKKAGLGPLKELFEIGLQISIHDKRLQNARKQHPKKLSARRKDKIQMPMSERKFPRSFWQEPNQQAKAKSKESDTSGNSMLSTTTLPDFSDLLDSYWTGYEGNVSSSSVNVANIHSAMGMENG